MGHAAWAQPGSTVQLPTFSFFSVGTTVSVPDRGSVYMGGVKRAATGRNEFGAPMLPFRPFRNSAIGMERSASSVRATAYIHDFDAMEEALMGQASSLQSSSYRPSSQWGPAVRPSRSQIAAYGNTLQPRNPAGGSSWHAAGTSGAALPQLSVADAKAEHAAQEVARNDKAADYFARGQLAEAGGKANVAKIYYQMAARRATGTLQQQVAARLEAIGVAQTGSQLAHGAP